MFNPLEVKDDHSLAKKLECLANGETIFTYRAYVIKGPEHDENILGMMRVRLYEWGKLMSSLLGAEMVDSGFTIREPRIEDPEPLDRVITYRIGLKRKCACKANY